MKKEELKQQAEYYRNLYRSGHIDYDTAKNMIQPYLNMLNTDYRNITKAYGRIYKEITFSEYIKKGY